MGGVGGGGGIPSDYLVSTQLQLWLFCCWGCGCCWAVTIIKKCYVLPSRLDELKYPLIGAVLLLTHTASFSCSVSNLAQFPAL